MDVSAVSRQFKGNLDVAGEAGLLHAGQNLFGFPGMAHDVVDEGRDGHIAGRGGRVGGQKGAHFSVVLLVADFAFQILGESIDVFGGAPQFKQIHLFFLPDFFFFLARAVFNGFPGFRLFGGPLFPGFQFGLDGLELIGPALELFRCYAFGLHAGDLRLAGLQLFQLHFVKLHCV